MDYTKVSKARCGAYSRGSLKRCCMNEADVKIENLEKQVSELKEYVKDFEKRLTLLEKNTAVSEEQIKMIYKI